jgi:hypothetical protein
MKRNGFEDWHLLNKEMNKGNLPKDIADWFIAHRNADNPEERAWFVHYFIFLHPETENVDKISNRDHNWDYVAQARIKREALANKQSS